MRKGNTIFECTCMCKLNAGYLSFDINRSLKSNTKSFYTLLKIIKAMTWYFVKENSCRLCDVTILPYFFAEAEPIAAVLEDLKVLTTTVLRENSSDSDSDIWKARFWLLSLDCDTIWHDNLIDRRKVPGGRGNPWNFLSNQT